MILTSDLAPKKGSKSGSNPQHKSPTGLKTNRKKAV